MDNLTAAKSLCNAMASAFYPDAPAVAVALANADIDPAGHYTRRDAAVFRVAVALVRGYVESSRSEGGLSVGVQLDAIRASIRHWCREYGVDAEELLGDSLQAIDNGSNLW